MTLNEVGRVSQINILCQENNRPSSGIHDRRFNNFRTGDFVWAGEHRAPIQGYGDVDIMIKVPVPNKQLMNVWKILRIRDVA